jgi:hypothetical protein
LNPEKANFSTSELQFALNTTAGVVYGRVGLPLELAVARAPMTVQEFEAFFADNAGKQVERALPQVGINERLVAVAQPGPPLLASFGLFGGRVAARIDYDPMYGARLVLRAESPRFLPLLAMREVIATLFSHQEDEDE